MAWLEILCPGCKARKDVPPGQTFGVCEKCATPHCHMHTSGPCKTGNCSGWLKERKNPS